MSWTKYILENRRTLVIIQDAVIGPPQFSIVGHVKKLVEEGNEAGELIEGRWFVIPTVEELGKEISKILNQEQRIKITVHGDEVISDRENVEQVMELLKKYQLYDELIENYDRINNMTAIEIYDEVEYIERVSTDGPVNYKHITILAMERYKNQEIRELEAKIMSWYIDTKDEKFKEFMGIEKQTYGNLYK